LLSEISK